MNFEEQFPSLKGKHFDIYGEYIDDELHITEEDIQKNCIDKQRVRGKIKEICTHEWENCGKRLLEELEL